MPAYRFGEFLLSPRRRLLLRAGRPEPLIPRYFDLLVFLVERRGDAVHRREIFDGVWRDVIVSDSALSQAIRTLRRTLGDDSKEPRFIATVSRHGYRFVFAGVVEEAEDAGPPAPAEAATAPAAPEAAPPAEPGDADPFEPLLERISRAPRSAGEEEDQRDAAERLHALGTGEALRRLGTRRDHEHARALLRDTRWESAQAGEVPLLGGPAPAATAWRLVALRVRRAARVAAAKWIGAAIGGGLAGAGFGSLGGVILSLAPGSGAPLSIAAVLAAIGGMAGAAGGAGAGAGAALAEAAVRSRRTLAMAAGGAAGGGLVGFAVQWLGRGALAALVGIHVEMGGAVEGLLIGGAAALGYAWSTRHAAGGLAAPRGARRWRAALLTACAAGLATLALTLADRPLVGGTVHAIAEASAGSQVTLTPLGRLIGEPDFGPVSRALLGTAEGALFGLGLAFGLTRRPR